MITLLDYLENAISNTTILNTGINFAFWKDTHQVQINRTKRRISCAIMNLAFTACVAIASFIPAATTLTGAMKILQDMRPATSQTLRRHTDTLYINMRWTLCVQLLTKKNASADSDASLSGLHIRNVHTATPLVVSREPNVSNKCRNIESRGWTWTKGEYTCTMTTLKN